MTGLHSNFALEQYIQVIIDDLIVGQNRISLVELCFFLVHVALKDLVKLVHFGLEPMLDIKLSQMVAHLSAVPALGLTDLANDLLSLSDQVLTLRLALLLGRAA